MEIKTLKYGYTDLCEYPIVLPSTRCKMALMEFKNSPLTVMIVNPKAFKLPRSCFEVLRRSIKQFDLKMKVHYRSVYNDIEVIKLPD